MTHSQPKSRKMLDVQQLLFGYDRGHTLLAASSPSAKKRANAILSDTDWDPRAASGTESYLSGRPLAGEKCYALMKTWRAPEMPRPGCVWTHVLLIEEADLARVSELEWFEKFLKKPETIGNYQTYLQNIDFDLEMTKTQIPQVELDQRVISDLVRLVYLDQYRPEIFSNSTGVEQGILALWSQQWPALRRRLSFRTAHLAATKSSSKSNFEIEFRELKNTPDHLIGVLVDDTLIRMIKDDICGTLQHDLRRFLWRYGADTNGRREDLLHLAYLYRELNAAKLASVDVASIIDQIESWYPKANEAHLLKADFVQSMEADYSLVPELDQFEVVRAMISRPRTEAFPELGPIDSESVGIWIKKRPTEMRNLLGAAADREDQFVRSLFSGISASKNKDFVWDLLPVSESAFLRASQNSLDHLLDKRIDVLKDDSLLAIIEGTKERASILEQLIPYLLMRDNRRLVAMVNDEAAISVTEAVVDQLSLAAQNEEPAVNTNWVECVKDHPEQIIYFAEFNAKRRSQLLVCRYLLNADTRLYPLTVWSNKLDLLENDLVGSVDLEFKVFLLIQALRSSENGAEILINDAFDGVYHALRGRKLPWRSEMHLAEYLPHIGWYNNWDKCLRLKIAAVGVCKSLGISKKATLAITSDSALRHELAEVWDE